MQGRVILVPFRDCGDGLRKQHWGVFLSAMRQLCPHIPIIRVEQSQDGKKFNRGKLLNIGAELAVKQGLEWFYLHDVDLIPNEDLAKWAYSSTTFTYEKPLHLGALWKSKYQFGNFSGGVLFIHKKDFFGANGYPNEMWGWGGEDDVLKERLISILRPMGSPPNDAAGMYMELPHPHQGDSAETKNMQRWEDTEKFSKNKTEGISTLQYKVEGTATDGNVLYVKVRL